MFRVINGDRLCAEIGSVKDVKSGWLFSECTDMPFQWGIGRFPTGHKMQKHYHLVRDRVPRHTTQELFLVFSGAVRVNLYSMDTQDLVYSSILRRGDMICFRDCIHSAEVLSDKTVIIESKNGPFVDSEQDKVRL